jgi:hypothetical protein
VDWVGVKPATAAQFASRPFSHVQKKLVFLFCIVIMMLFLTIMFVLIVIVTIIITMS